MDRCPRHSRDWRRLVIPASTLFSLSEVHFHVGRRGIERGRSSRCRALTEVQCVAALVDAFEDVLYLHSCKDRIIFPGSSRSMQVLRMLVSALQAHSDCIRIGLLTCSHLLLPLLAHLSLNGRTYSTVSNTPASRVTITSPAAQALVRDIASDLIIA